MPLHPLLAARRSPRAWSAAPVTSDDLRAVLEAARWAPSHGNAQPWHYVVTRRGDARHAAVCEHLSRGNRGWAPAAPVLLVATARTVRDDGSSLTHAWHDLGQATAHLTFEATARGLAVHQMAGFDAAAVHAVLDLAVEVEVVTLVALGVAGDPSTLDDRLREKEERPRTRKALSAVASGNI